MVISPIRSELIVNTFGRISLRFYTYLELLTNRVNALHKERTKSITNSDTPYTVLDEEDSIFVDTTSGNVTVNLPAVASSTGRKIRVTKTVAANTVTIDGDGSETINGATTATLTAQYENDLYYCDGGEWYIETT